MSIQFECYSQNASPKKWDGALTILQLGNPCEAIVSARGSSFHLIVGTHAYGNYLCIPSWNVGVELASLTDDFWNAAQLRQCSSLKKADICSLLAALHVIAGYLND